MADPRTQEAITLMTRFAERTGVGRSEPASQRRYLWTDAYAVCTFLGLAERTGDGAYLDDALRLVDAVHHVLGRHRPDEARQGWISGAPDAAGEAHPLRGGLRIGKSLPERAPGEPMDERLEWDRDGQYFHYLTKWMHALDQVAWATRQPLFNVWARELAHVAHRGFTYAPPGGARPRMHWKMSIDLSRPLVAAMGQHDPLDGFVTCVQLQAAVRAGPARLPALTDAVRDYGAMIEPGALVTDDPLGLGGVLADASRVEQLVRRGALPGGERLLAALLEAALDGLGRYATRGDLDEPAERRLAFRELGLAIGLAAVEQMVAAARGALEQLARFVPLRARVESCWRSPAHRRSASWQAHQDINDVMLAASLVPEGVLVLRGGALSGAC